MSVIGCSKGEGRGVGTYGRVGSRILHIPPGAHAFRRLLLITLIRLKTVSGFGMVSRVGESRLSLPNPSVRT